MIAGVLQPGPRGIDLGRSGLPAPVRPDGSALCGGASSSWRNLRPLVLRGGHVNLDRHRVRGQLLLKCDPQWLKRSKRSCTPSRFSNFAPLPASPASGATKVAPKPVLSSHGAAMRARQRQFEMRDQLAELDARRTGFADAAERLEAEVAARTSDRKQTFDDLRARSAHAPMPCSGSRRRGRRSRSSPGSTGISV